MIAQGFTLAPRAIIETDRLSDSTKLVYLKLTDYAFNQIYCFPKLETLCQSLNVSVSTVKRATKELREFGLIKIYREHFRSSNHYILVPIEWVTNFEGELTAVPEEEQYLDSEEEFNALVARIRNYYEELATQMEPKPKKKVTTPRKTKSVAELTAEVEAKLENENYDLNNRELVVAFSIYNRKLRNSVTNINWSRDTAVMKQIFEQAGIKDGRLKVAIIRKYVEVYDYNWKSANYANPTITGLRMAFIFDKVRNLAETELRNSTKQEDTYSGEIVEF